MATRRISDEQRRHRIGVRHALARPLESVEAVTEALVCLHATEPASVHLAVAARSGCSIADVDRALYDDRSVVKQLAMRRTVFAFPRELLPAVWGSASARVHAQISARLAKEVAEGGIATDGRAWVEDTWAAVLQRLAEEPTTTAELRAQVPAMEARLAISPDKKYGGEFPIAPRVLTTLASSGQVLRGANVNGWKVSRPRWTLTGDWLGEVPPALESADGYRELVRRWLDRFGPGTEDDIVWWLGATKGAVRRALADLEAEQVSLEGPDPVGWVLPGDTDEEDPGDWAALVPAMDPTVMGWKGRDFYLDPAQRSEFFDVNGNAGQLAWWRGRIVGGWGQREDGSVVVVPLGELPRAATAALDVEATRLSEWLDGDRVSSIYQCGLVRRALAG